VAVTCCQNRMECFTYEMDQIGPNQVSRLDSPTSYPVTKWDASEFVAAGDADAVSCRRTTIASFENRKQSCGWKSRSINQCRPARMPIRDC
jgi:hypothetical protein